MPEEVRLWTVKPGDQLEDIPQSRLELESRIETWLAKDISLLDRDLLVIGRQVGTDHGGTIDLLCIDRNGDLVIVELKRDQTPRTITAQALDYASWVHELSADRITTIAAQHLGDDGLAKAFSKRFGVDLPDALNGDHRMIVVGSEIDAASERIITYLNDVHGVNINAATFQFFRTAGGQELLARVFLITPEQAEQRSQARGNSKRAPNLTLEDLKHVARTKNVGDLYTHAVERLQDRLIPSPTRSGLSFYADTAEGNRAVLKLLPGESGRDRGLCFQIYSLRLAKYLGLPEESVRTLLPKSSTTWQSPNATGTDGMGVQGHFTSIDEVDRFASALAVSS